MFFMYILLLLPLTTRSFEETNISLADIEHSDEFILCRNCGSDISSSHFLAPFSSPQSQHAFNDTLFNKERVLIQVLSNGIIFDFPVITATQSNCVTVGEWEEQESWFPGYRWKLCVCPDCGEYIGWLFDPLTVQQPAKPFFGLILSSLIGESCNYSFSYRFTLSVSRARKNKLDMAAVDTLSAEDNDFLLKCEEEFKHRYTEKDEEFMKVHNSEASTPPIIESWWVPQNAGRRNDRRNNRRNHPYERQGNKDRNYQDRRDHYDRREDRRGYHNYEREQGHRNQRPRYY